MAVRQLQIFISSKMLEFLSARAALKSRLEALSTPEVKITVWTYEQDAEALADRSIQEKYLATLGESDLYLGLFGKEYGKYTIEEYHHAQSLALPLLIFISTETAARAPELQAFLDREFPVERKPAPQFFPDEAELLRLAENSVRLWKESLEQKRPGYLQAVYVKDQTSLPEKLPKKLLGRDDLIAKLEKLFTDSEKVLIFGMGGMGKTVLASTLAARHLEAKPGGVVMWHKLGSDEARFAFAAIAKPFGHDKTMLGAPEAELPGLLRQILKAAGVTLVILDDAWEAGPLMAVLNAIPDTLPVLVTSRHRYPLDLVYPVDKLTPPDAIATLGFYAGREDYSTDPAAAELCQLLGYHPYAIEIAGRMINTEQDNAGRKPHPKLIFERLKAAPAQATMPSGFADAGRENIAAVLDLSLYRLEAGPRAAFKAAGAFFHAQFTAELIAEFLSSPSLYSERGLGGEVDSTTGGLGGEVDSTTGGLGGEVASPAKGLGGEVLESGDSSQDLTPNPSPSTERGFNAALPATPSTERGFNAGADLKTLADKGLLEALHPEEGVAIAHYRLHDLAYSYAYSQNSDEDHRRALKLCLAYAERYGKPNLANFAALRPVAENLTKAATDYALGAGDYESVWDLAGQLYAGGSEILDYLGLYSLTLPLLEAAVAAAKAAGNRQHEGVWLGNLGLAYADLGQVERAIEYHEQALKISREIGDKRAEGQDLGNLGNAYAALGQVERAIGFYEQQLVIVREIGDRRGEGNALGNLGLAYADLGQVERAIATYEQRLVIAREIGDRRGEGNALGNLGNAYADLGQVERAIGYYEQAIAIRREIGDKHGLASTLNNLGLAYEKQADYPRALALFQQARALYAEMGMGHRVADTDGNIALVQAKLAGGG